MGEDRERFKPGRDVEETASEEESQEDVEAHQLRVERTKVMRDDEESDGRDRTKEV